MTRRFLICIFLTALLSALPICARADATNSAVTKSAVLENGVVYLRVGSVGKNLADEIQSAENSLPSTTTNKIVGTILDLRFAVGEDLDSAKAAASFLEQKKLPLAILINEETTGAAVQLAAALRAAHAGLIFGSAAENLSPDIFVKINPAEEKKFLENPYAMVLTNAAVSIVVTNDFLPIIDRTTEADLVRHHIKDGDEDESTAGPVAPEPFLRDPVLARAADFLKAEAIWREGRE